jgi:hypothetical protein
MSEQWVHPSARVNGADMPGLVEGGDRDEPPPGGGQPECDLPDDGRGDNPGDV